MAIEITTVRPPRRLPRLRRRSVAEIRARHERAERRALLLRVCAAVMLVSGVGFVATLAYCYHTAARQVDARLAAGYLTSRAGIYAAPRVLRAGQKLSRAQLVETLRRAGYVENAASDVWSGAFTAPADADAVEIQPRRSGAAAPDVVRISFDGRGRIGDITGDGLTLPAFALEPETLTNDTTMKTGQRAALAYADIPPVLVHAILAIEDRRFFAHHGVDPTGVGRALLSWTGLGRGGDDDNLARQGGSTITQQLVKNTYLTPERTLRRKFDEALLATALERRLSKEDIFALYCNEVYLGQRGPVAVRGVAQAARSYFNKELPALTLTEAATIAGMIQSPARYAPDRHPEAAQARRNVVLAGMLRDGAISAAQASAVSHTPVTVAPLAADVAATAPYFVDYVNRVVDTRLLTTADRADERSLRVYTTLDLDLQQLAEATVRSQSERLAKVFKGRAAPQVALVALDPQTGHVLAMVGGNSYAVSQLNRATDARRQPGSVFKPFVYATALEAGISPVAMFNDAPQTFSYDRRAVYRPTNYGNSYSMRPVTMRAGLVHSLNVVTVDLALRTGLQRVAATAARFGLPKPEAYPALALGTTETTPLEIASAYTAFANNGVRATPAAVTSAADANGASLFAELAPTAQQVIRPATAYMLTDMLTGVVEEGTARAARGLERETAIAGKTGTSRDGWFAGYTPNLVCVVWVGFDDNKELGLTGAASALPIWQEFVQGAIELRPDLGGDAFVRPAGITTVEIDPETGLLAAPACPHRQRLAVTPALAPTSECFTHQLPLTLATLDTTTAPAAVPALALAAPPPVSAPPVAISLPPAPANSRPTSRTYETAPAAGHKLATEGEPQARARTRLTNDLQVVAPPTTRSN